MEKLQESDVQKQIQYVYIKKESGCFTGCLKFGCAFWIIVFLVFACSLS
jgi:hypothetical protein